MSDTPKSNALQMFIWTFLMILGWTSSIIARVFTQAEASIIPQYWAWLGVVGGMLVVYFSIQRMVKLTNTWREILKRTILDQATEIIAHWQYATAEWTEFMKRELRRKYKGMLFGVWAGVMILILGTIGVAWFNDSGERQMIYTLIENFVIMGGVLSFVVWKYQRKMDQIYLKHNPPEVHFSQQGALINREWGIPFRRVSAYLLAIEVLKKHDQDCLKLSIYELGYEANATKEHFIPIPHTREDQVEALVHQLRKSSTAYREALERKKK